MATTVTLTSLISSVRQRADLENTQFVTDTELTNYINASYAELYDLLVQKYGDNYFVKDPAYTFVTDGTNDMYALPTDFYKLLGVDLQINAGGSEYVALANFEFNDRNRLSGPTSVPFYGTTQLRYRIHGGKLWLSPKPEANLTIRVWYVPKITYLVLGADTLDGISGWEEYVIIDAAIKAGIKEEQDVTPLLQQKQLMTQRIESAAENRDAGRPPKVVDTYFHDIYNSSGFGGWDAY